MSTARKDHTVMGQVQAPRDIQELEELLRAGQDVVSIAITPTVAQQILENWNDGNRKRNELRLQRYRRDMAENRWLRGSVLAFGVFDGEEVQFGNGQHRMLAQVATGTTQEHFCRVFTDKDEMAVYVLTVDDPSVGRRLSDHVQVFGISNSAGSAQLLANVVSAMLTFIGRPMGKLSQQEQMAYAMEHVKSLRFVLSLPRRQFKAHIMAAIALAHSKHATRTESVIADVLSGAMLQKGSAALEIMQSLPDFNDARKLADKDRAVGRLLRGLHAGITGKRITGLVRSRTTGNYAGPTVEAIASLVDTQVADAWAARQERRQ